MRTGLKTNQCYHTINRTARGTFIYFKNFKQMFQTAHHRKAGAPIKNNLGQEWKQTRLLDVSIQGRRQDSGKLCGKQESKVDCYTRYMFTRNAHIAMWS